MAAKRNSSCQSVSNGSSGSIISTLSVAEQNLHDEEHTIQELVAHISSLREELQMLVVTSQSTSPQVSILLEDLKRLTCKNADLCNALAATQCSRNILERDIIVLKRTRLEERCKGSSATHFLEIKDLLMQNEKLKKTLDRRQLEMDDKLKSCENENIRLNQAIERLRDSQLTEIDQRCSEVDALKVQLSGQLNVLQQEHDSLSQQVASLSAEKNSLLSSLSELQDANHCLNTELLAQKQEFKSQLKSMSDQAAQMKLENKTLLSQLKELQQHESKELQQAKAAYVEVKNQFEQSTTNMQSVISELDSARKTNLNFSRQVADLRQEVERLKAKLTGCLQINKELKHALIQSKSRVDHLETTVENSSAVLCSMEFDGHQAEVSRLKHRLAASQQSTVQLEVQLAQLKTDNAKLSGCYQAVLSLRDRLSLDNHHFRQQMRDLQHNKNSLLKEKNELVSKVEEMSSATEMLTSDLSALKNELYQLSELNRGMESELGEYKVQGSGARVQLKCLQNIVETEVHKFNLLLRNFDDSLADQKQEMLDLQENIRICEYVNSTRHGQIEMCGENVVRLHGELEVLRARRSVLLCISEQNYSTSALSVSTLDCSKLHKLKQKLKVQRKQANCLRVKLGNQQHSCPCHCKMFSDPTGYTLTELRLYKQLKAACDQQLCELRECLRKVQEQYCNCAAKLENVE